MLHKLYLIPGKLFALTIQGITQALGWFVTVTISIVMTANAFVGNVIRATTFITISISSSVRAIMNFPVNVNNTLTISVTKIKELSRLFVSNSMIINIAIGKIIASTKVFSNVVAIIGATANLSSDILIKLNDLDPLLLVEMDSQTLRNLEAY